MSQAFALRPVERRDMPAVVELVCALATYEELTPPDDAAIARLVADVFCERPPVEILVAESEPGEIVGYAAYLMMYSTFVGRPSLYLEDLFVRPEARGRGIGVAFLTRLAALALERGCGRFDWTVLDWNVEAQGFYRSLGAEVMPGYWTCRLEGPALEALASGTMTARRAR